MSFSGIILRDPSDSRSAREISTGIGGDVATERRSAILRGRPARSAAAGAAATSFNGRIHNRSEITRQLDCPAGDIDDATLFARAYAIWGEDCFARIYGDWSFAAWHADEHRLVLARDHSGTTALYYHDAPGIFAFSANRRDLLALRLAPVALDELYLAQIIVSWPAYGGAQTVHRGINRLPPAHVLTVTPQRVTTRCYWRLEDTPERQISREDCIAGLRGVLDLAVRERIDGGGSIATTLSGGLDSGSVSVTAAGMLADGRRLDAYVAVPLGHAPDFAGGPAGGTNISGDETRLASAAAEFAGNIDLHPLRSANLSPIAAIHEVLSIVAEPQHAAGNMFWLLDLYRSASAAGHATVLTGQLGNGAISWTGGMASQSFRQQLRALGFAGWAKREVRRNVPPAFDRQWRRWRDAPLFPNSAILPAFADRMELRERRIADPASAYARSARDERLDLLQPGRSIGGATHAELARACGIGVSDPTADARVQAFCLSIADRMWVSPDSGLSRWPIREAMKGRLPDTVRLNRVFGLQASDLALRLRACRDEVEQAIDEIARGPAAGYIDARRLRAAWGIVQEDDGLAAYQAAATIVTRGIMAGLFVNEAAGSGYA